MPELTVVIPVYNRADMVERTLRSVAAQTLRPLRVVLVDNGSTDSTLGVLRRWKADVEAPDFRVTVIEELTPGACAARDRGLEEVTTDCVMFFDSDDEMAPGHCARAIEGFMANPGASIVGWDTLHRYPDGTTRRGLFSAGDALWHTIQHASLATQRYCMTTALVRRAGGWDNACPAWNDIELGVRLLLLSPGIVKINGAPTVTVNSHPDSITGTAFAPRAEVWENSLNMIENSLARAGRMHEIRWVNLRRAILAGIYYREGSPDLCGRLMSAILAKEPSPRRRIILRAAMLWTRHGRRGAARLFRHFI